MSTKSSSIPFKNYQNYFSNKIYFYQKNLDNFHEAQRYYNGMVFKLAGGYFAFLYGVFYFQKTLVEFPVQGVDLPFLMVSMASLIVFVVSLLGMPNLYFLDKMVQNAAYYLAHSRTQKLLSFEVNEYPSSESINNSLWFCYTNIAFIALIGLLAQGNRMKG
jgi:hypothetical protein